jgi:hypothetical protein
MRIFVSVFVGACLLPAVFGQDAVYPPPNPSPARIEDQIILLGESVAQNQWTHTLDLVNVAQNTTLLNPGQCIRVGVIAAGDNRDDYLRQTKLSFNVGFAGHTEQHGPALISSFKRIKPEGGDFVAGALAAAKIKIPDRLRSMASLGVSAANWCAPPDARDGTASVQATIEGPGAPPVSAASTIAIETFETGRKKAFSAVQEFGQFLQTYYRQPNPARLLPAIEFMVKEQTEQPRPGQAEMVAAFVSAALRANATAGRDMLARIGAEPPLVRAFGLLALHSAGYDIAPVLGKLPKEEQEKFRSLPALEDPFDLTASAALFHRLDMLWCVFGATGEYEPVKAIAGALAWRPDYEAFVKLRNSPNRPTTLSPSIVRGVAYTAAGWSLGSFQAHDGLVTDYIDYMLASPETPPAIKSELTGLSTNPAFKQSGGK